MLWTGAGEQIELENSGSDHGISSDSGPATPVAIDVDAPMDIDTEITEIPTVSAPTKSSHRPQRNTLCEGFIFPFSGAGQTTSSDYPYGLHDMSHHGTSMDVQQQR